MEVVLTIIFTIDITLNFFLSFEEEDSDLVIGDHRQIIQTYLLGYFTIDLIATIPVSLIFNSNINLQSFKFIKIIKLVRLLRLTKAFNFINFN